MITGTARKIKENKGASLIIAMVVFLAATFVSVVIITTSLTAVKRVKDDRSEEKNYLAVSSACRLMSDCLSTSKCKRVLESEDPDTVDKVYTYIGTEGWFGDMLAEMVYSVNNPSDISKSHKKSFLINPFTDPSDKRMPDCYVEMEMGSVVDPAFDDSYTIEGFIMIKESADASAPVEYRVYFEARLDINSDDVYQCENIKMRTTRTGS